MTKKNLNFEDSLAKLEGIVDALEDDDVSLEESVKKFEEGIKLVKDCQKQLQEAELTVNKLMSDGEILDQEN